MGEEVKWRSLVHAMPPTILPPPLALPLLENGHPSQAASTPNPAPYTAAPSASGEEGPLPGAVWSPRIPWGEHGLENWVGKYNLLASWIPCHMQRARTEPP